MGNEHRSSDSKFGFPQAIRGALPKARWSQLGWRLGIGAALIVGGYAALLLIPFVVAADLEPSVKTVLTALIGATPLLTQLVAIALLGRSAFNLLKRYGFKFLHHDLGQAGKAARL